MSQELRVYETALEDAMGAGVSVLAPTVPAYDWLYPECVFFASTIITTIGECRGWGEGGGSRSVFLLPSADCDV